MEQQLTVEYIGNFLEKSVCFCFVQFGCTVNTYVFKKNRKSTKNFEVTMKSKIEEEFVKLWLEVEVEVEVEVRAL